MSTAFAKFREKATASDSVYLRPGEIDGTIKVRFIPWILKGKLVPIHFYYEGWAAPAKKNDKPKCIRLPFNEEGLYDADEDIVWHKGDYGIQKPAPAFVGVIANLTDKKIQIVSGTQKGLVGPLSEFCDPDSERYVKNWSLVDIIITRDPKTKKFTVEREKLDRDEAEIPWLENEIEGFHFTMKDYLNGEKTPEGEGDTYRDVLNMIGDRPEKEEKDKKEFDEVRDWGNVTTPKGRILRQCTLEELTTMKETLEKSKKFDPKNELYRAILSGIKANEQPPFEEEDETGI